MSFCFIDLLVLCPARLVTHAMLCHAMSSLNSMQTQKKNKRSQPQSPSTLSPSSPYLIRAWPCQDIYKFTLQRGEQKHNDI